MTPDLILADSTAGTASLIGAMALFPLLMLGFFIGTVTFSLWMTYKFYSRVREIANEIRHIRIACQQLAALQNDPPLHRAPHNPRAPSPRHSDDSKYMPKP